MWRNRKDDTETENMSGNISSVTVLMVLLLFSYLSGSLMMAMSSSEDLDWRRRIRGVVEVLRGVGCGRSVEHAAKVSDSKGGGHGGCVGGVSLLFICSYVS